MNEENKFEDLFKKYNDDVKQFVANLIEESDRKTSVLIEESDEKTGALNEEFQSRLSAVAEGVTLLNEKVDRIEIVQNEHTKILNNHTEILNHHTEKLDSHAEMIGEQMEHTSEIKIELENKVDKKEFIDLKQTVLAM